MASAKLKQTNENASSCRAALSHLRFYVIYNYFKNLVGDKRNLKEAAKVINCKYKNLKTKI